jgi:hypothetical protein
MKIAMMIIMRDKSNLVVLLCLMKIFTGNKLKTLHRMTPSFRVPQTHAAIVLCVVTSETMTAAVAAAATTTTT